MLERPASHRNALLRALNAEDCAALVALGTHMQLDRGDVVQEPGAPITHVYFPLHGMLSLLMNMSTGEAIETGVVGCDGAANVSVITQPLISVVEINVQIAGDGYRIPAPAFVKFCNEKKSVAELMNRFQAVIVMQAQQNAGCHAHHPVQARLCRWLLQASDVTMSDKFYLTQDFLSHMLGTQRSAVSIGAHQLQSAGLIHYSRGHIEILKREVLEESACECRAAIKAYTNQMLPDASA